VNRYEYRVVPLAVPTVVVSTPLVTVNIPTVRVDWHPIAAIAAARGLR
jgi:hypothetical protein